jgi:hypothetical protein
MPPVGKLSRAAKRFKPNTSFAENPSKLSCRARNDEKWTIYMEDIRRAYVDEDKTLKETMMLVGLTASERKWKEKLKEWGFQKNLPASDMAILVSKREKRLRDDGKDTTFYLKSGLEGSDLVEVRVEKLENFKKRKIAHIIQPSSPSASKFYKKLSELEWS